MPTGYVYALKTRSFRAIKIGSTTKTPEERAAELSGTGCPHPFKVIHSVLVDDCQAAEREIHRHFADKRVSRKREFFWISTEEAITALDELSQRMSTRNRLPKFGHYPIAAPPQYAHSATNRFAEDILRDSSR